MKLIELFESARSDLFHGTNLPRVEEIITNNKMIANMPVRSSNIPTTVRGYDKTVSFSRNKQQAISYARGASNHPSLVATVLVIDQDILKQIVGKRLQPYDDIPTDAYRQSYARWNRGATPPSSMNRSDAEEVVFGDIANINKCIKQIILYPHTGIYIDDNNKSIQKSPLMNDKRTMIQYKGKTYTPSNYLEFVATPDINKR